MYTISCDTNPTAKQFTAAYKRLVLGAYGQNFSLSGNIFGQDETYSLDVFKTKTSGIQYIERGLELEEVQHELQDELESFDTNLSKFSNIIYSWICEEETTENFKMSTLSRSNQLAANLFSRKKSY